MAHREYLLSLIEDAIEAFQQGEDIALYQEIILLDAGVDVQALREQHTPE